MLEELQPLPDNPGPQPGDLIQLHPQTPHTQPDGLYTVVDRYDLADTGPTLEINHPHDHPQYEDWAAAVHTHHVATITRLGANGPRTWAP